MTFRISDAEVTRRRKNNFLGLIFSIGLMLVLAVANASNQEKYNDMLLLSMVVFFVFANIINMFRHQQWQNQIRGHRLERSEAGLVFIKGDERNELRGDQIAKLRIKEKDNRVHLIFVELTTGNKIRLEGYDHMDGLADLLRKMVPPETTG